MTIKSVLEDLPKNSAIVLESADEQYMAKITTNTDTTVYSIKVWESAVGEETAVVDDTFNTITLALRGLNELADIEWDEYKDRATLKDYCKRYHNALWYLSEIIADQKELCPLDITNYSDRDTFVAAVCDYYQDAAPEKFSS